MRTPYPLIFSAILLLPACASNETAPMSDAGSEPETDAGAEQEAGAEDSGGTGVDSTVADTNVGDTTVLDTASDDTRDAGVDTGTVTDTRMDTTVVDTAVVDTGTDTGFKSTDHVHIYITNTCKVSVSPTSFTVPAGETLKLSYHNHSVDYRADVWMMYGGGYLGLDRGATWNETYTHCFGPSASTGYADINIEGGPTSGCPGVRLYIYCK